MSIAFPSAPSNDQEFIAAGKAWTWNGSRWLRSEYSIIDGGNAGSEQNTAKYIYDGGTA